MSEPIAPRPPELEPGTIIELSNIAELPVFEDAIAPYVEPEFDPEIWATRPPVDELLRPRINGRLFYGSLGNITLAVMADPYEKLLSARDREWKLTSRGNLNRTGIDADQAIAHYFGVEFSAEAFTSSQRSAIGLVTAEMWYYPPPRAVRRAGKVQSKSYQVKSGEVRTGYYTATRDYVNVKRSSGETIRRVVTQPNYEADKFIELDERSRRIGFELAREAIRHPLPGSFESS